MSLTVGARLGSYEIVAPLGAGGMGEVYRARDTKLNRDVAIKILPETFATDADRVARFEREAQLLAALNHPHIAAIYGLEESNATRLLVLEFVEGQSLAQWIAKPSALSPQPHAGLPVTEALALARQIVDALEAAHEKGIIHRDLKPANIMVTSEGQVKVLDFGLAKLDPGSASLSGERDNAVNSPTLTLAATQAGVILGTAAYMSPEQAKGRGADKRSDVWAFGCVCFEMLTGTRAFPGEDASDTLAAVLRAEPDWSAIPPDLPAHITSLVKRCLDKDRRTRIPEISVVRFLMDEASSASAAGATATRGVAMPPRATRREWLAWTIAALAVVAGVVATTLYVRRTPPEPVLTRFEIQTPPTSDPVSFALSADGRQLAFVANAESVPRLWVRPLDQVTAQPLAGTDGASYPFWSPDGKAIGFFAGGKLKRIDLGGGAPQVLANAPFARGGTWNANGVIVFAPAATGPQAVLMRVAATGGTPTPVTRSRADQTSHRFPLFLPDGRRFLFFSGSGQPEARGVYVGSLDGGEPTRVVAADTPAAYAPGLLLLLRGNVLVAQRFDAVSGVISGEPMPVAQAVGSDLGTGPGAFSVSATGVLAHRAVGAGRRQLVWVDRGGTVQGSVGLPEETGLNNPELSPDGRRLAVSRVVQGNSDVWLIDIARGVPTRFTFHASINSTPLWSPDGRRVVFRSNRNGVYDLFEKPANGGGDEQPILVTPQSKTPLAWSPDGRVLLYAALDSKTAADLWALPMVGERKPFPVVQTPFDEVAGQFSPDGRWVAYQSNESGRTEILVRPFPGAGGQWQASAAGGSQPRWQPDGKELFYVAPDARLMAVPIAVGDAGRTLDAGAPVPLFVTRLAGGTGSGLLGSKPQYAVAADRRFLMNVAVDEGAASPITIVLNWDSVLKRSK